MYEDISRLCKLCNTTPQQAYSIIDHVNRSFQEKVPYEEICMTAESQPKFARYPRDVVWKLGKLRENPDFRRSKSNSVELAERQKNLSAYNFSGLSTDVIVLQITTQVVGVTYNDRPGIVAKLSLGESVVLHREPNNPHDNNAIMVLRQTGEQIGYINRILATSVAPRIDSTKQDTHAIVINLSGSGSNDYNHGVTIQFMIV